MKNIKDKTYIINIENVTEKEIETFEKFMNSFIELGHFYNIHFEEKKDD